jgi:hypothetical protein
MTYYITFEFQIYKLCAHTNATIKHDDANLLIFEKFIDDDTLMTATYLKDSGKLVIEYGTIYEAEYFYIENEEKLLDHLFQYKPKSILFDAYWKLCNSEFNFESEA